MSASPTPIPAELVSVKIAHQGLTRRLSLPAHPTPAWAALAAEVQARFGLAEEAKANLGLSYVDEDGDAIILSSDLELAELWTALVAEEAFTQPKFTVVDLAAGNNNTNDNKEAGKDGHLTELLSQVRLAVEADPTVAMQLRGVVHEAFAGQYPGPHPHPHHFHGHPHHYGPRGLPGRFPHGDMKAAHQQAREARHLARAARRLAREERRTARNSSDSSLSTSEDSSTSDSSSDSEDDRRKGKGKGRKHHYGRHHDLFGPGAGPFGFGKGFGKHGHRGTHGHHFGGPGGPAPPFPPGSGGPGHGFGQHHPFAGFGGPRGGFGGRGRGGFGGGPFGRHSHFMPGPEAGPSGFHHHGPPPPFVPEVDIIEVDAEGHVIPPAFEEGDERRHRKGGRHGRDGGKHDRAHARDHGHGHGRGERKERGEKGERA